MRTERIEVADGVALAADAWTPAAASGPPFLLVHGLASNARIWDGVAGALVALGHPVVTVDLRGHGRSSKPDGPYDVPTVAGDLAALIERMGLDRPVVAGQSWGGNVVLELAVRRPSSRAGSSASTAAGWSRAASSPTGTRAATALAPPRFAGRRLEEIESYVRKAHRDWPESGHPRRRWPTSRSGRTGRLPRGSPSTATWRSSAGSGSTTRPRSTPRVPVPALLVAGPRAATRTATCESARTWRRLRRRSRRPRPLVHGRPRHPCAAPGRIGEVMHEMVVDGLFGMSGPRILAIMGSGRDGPDDGQGPPGAVRAPRAGARPGDDPRHPVRVPGERRRPERPDGPVLRGERRSRGERRLLPVARRRRGDRCHGASPGSARRAT